MEKKLNDKIMRILIVPVGLAIILVTFSMMIGFNLPTSFLFWFILTPAITIYLPIKVSSIKNHLPESLTGLTIFYGLMIFMIYDHYKTDYFQLMVVSYPLNLVLVSLISLAKRPQAETK